MSRAEKRKALIISLFNKQDGKCYLCARQMTLELDLEHTATIDHVIPRSRFQEKGFYESYKNKKAACWRCNHWKGNRTAEEFLDTSMDEFFIVGRKAKVDG